LVRIAEINCRSPKNQKPDGIFGRYRHRSAEPCSTCVAWHKHRRLGERSPLRLGPAGLACGWRN
jgi:hypothetical protein